MQVLVWLCRCRFLSPCSNKHRNVLIHVNGAAVGAARRSFPLPLRKFTVAGGGGSARGYARDDNFDR